MLVVTTVERLADVIRARNQEGVAPMKSLIGVERFLEGAEYGLRRRPESTTYAAHRPVITISRQAGSGAHVVAQALVAGLQARDPQASPPWTMFDRDLVERVLKDHRLPKRLAEFMPEDRVSGITDHRRAPGGPSPRGRWFARRPTRSCGSQTSATSS